MKIRHIPQRNDINIISFNKLNYPNIALSNIKDIAIFLKKEGYYLIEVKENEIILNKGSINGALSFIDYKFPLFRNVKFEYEQTGINDCLVYISENN